MKGFAPELYGATRGGALVVFALPKGDYFRCQDGE
jgi:hypothetical protein